MRNLVGLLTDIVVEYAILFKNSEETKSVIALLKRNRLIVTSVNGLLMIGINGRSRYRMPRSILVG